MSGGTVKSSLIFDFPDDILKNIETRLDGLRKPEAVAKIVANNTARQIQRLLAQKAADRYAGRPSSKSAIISGSKIKKTNAGKNPEVTISFKSPVFELNQFKVPGGKTVSTTKYTAGGKRVKRTLKATVIKGQGGPIDSGFVVKFLNVKKNWEITEHISIVTRRTGKYCPRRNRKGTYYERSSPHYEVLKKLVTVSHRKMIEGDQVYKAAGPEMETIIQNEANKVVGNILRKAGK